jgi:hypothetical protein
MAAVFLAQQMLQTWADQGQVVLDDNTLTLVAEARTVQLRPAVRFTGLVGGGDDVNKLVGKVKSLEQLRALGAEHYMDSVIHGDVAYQVVEGFLGDLSPQPAPARDPVTVVSGAAVADPTQHASAPPGAEPDTTSDEAAVSPDDVDALNRLFLATVSG